MIEAICQGSPYEMGRAQGIALRGKIHAAHSSLSDLEAFRQQRPWWLPFPLYQRVAEGRAARLLAAPLKRCYPEFSQRLQGLADGAGVNPSVPYLFNALEPLLSYIGGSTACPGACSAIAVRGVRSARGEPMIGRNFDYLPLVQPFYTMRECRPKDGYRSVEFTVAPLVGAVDGMNERGLCITYDYAFTTDADPASPIPISVLIGETLQRCGTVAEAAAWMASRPRWGGGLLMLADAEGDIASLELSATRSHLRSAAPGEDFLFHTNCFSSLAMREVQIPDDAVYTRSAPTPLRGQKVHRSSERRNQRYQELLASMPVLDDDRLSAIMADHGASGIPSETTPCVHSSYWNTTACLQFFPKSRRMRVAFDSACQARYQEIVL
jgi:Acyl-coenzyme A:6-aminopenicillanic acid acyl-transferase